MVAATKFLSFFEFYFLTNQTEANLVLTVLCLFCFVLFKGLSCCAMCGTGITSNNTTPCSSVVMGGGGGGGEYCASTTASPVGHSMSMSMSVSMVNNNNINKIGFGGSTSSSLPEGDNSPLELYIYDNGLPGGLHHHPSSPSGGCVGGPLVMGPQYPQQQQQIQLYVQEAMASNQNTPVGSPLRRA